MCIQKICRFGFSLILFSIITAGNAGVLKTVAGGGEQDVDLPIPGASATSVFVNAYGVQQGLTRHFYLPSYDMGSYMEESIDGVVRVNPYGVIDWTAITTFGCLDDIAVDFDGSVFVTEACGGRVHHIGLDGIVTVIAGTGVEGSEGDDGLATEAQLSGPEGLAIDEQGNLYILEMDLCIVRKVERETGIISTVAGNREEGCGYNGDSGPADVIQLDRLRKLAIDKAGHIYIPDDGNKVVWKVDLTAGTTQRIAGIPGVAGYTGDGGPALEATFDGSRGVDVDQWGNIYVVDRYNNVIRRIDPSGIIMTIAGNGGYGYLDHATDPTQGMLKSPTDVSVDLDGQLYIADYGNRLIRRVAFNPEIDNVTPRFARIGHKLILTGRYFGTYKGDSSVELNGVTLSASDIVHWSNTEIHLLIPEGAKRGRFVVNAEGGSSHPSRRIWIR